MDAPTTTTWWSRLLPSMPRWLRSLVVPWHPSSIGVGAAGAQARADFPPIKSLSAMAAFPTVYASANAISLDLAGLPIRVQLGEGTGAEILTEHPFLDLIAMPSSSCTQRRLRRQLYMDEALTGNGVIWLDQRGAVPALRRLHPQHAVPDVNKWGDILGWTYGEDKLPARDVHLVAGPSWSDRTNMVLGETPIRSLQHDLEAMRQAKKHAAKAAGAGRPDFHFTAPADSPLISEKAMAKVVEKFEEMLSGGRRAVFTAGGLNAEQLTWNLRDLEYQSVVESSEKAALIVMGVPAVRLGLPNANYGEAKVQMRQYWEGLLYRASAWDDALTRIARELDPDGRPVRVKHDSTNIEALQRSYEQRQARAATWVQVFGADPADAAAFEGFPDAPTGEPGDGSVSRPAQEVDELQEERRRLQIAIEVLLGIESAQYDAADSTEYDQIRQLSELNYTTTLRDLGLGDAAAKELACLWSRRGEATAHIVEQCSGHATFDSRSANQMALQATIVLLRGPESD